MTKRAGLRSTAMRTGCNAVSYTHASLLVTGPSVPQSMSPLPKHQSVVLLLHPALFSTCPLACRRERDVLTAHSAETPQGGRTHPSTVANALNTPHCASLVLHWDWGRLGLLQALAPTLVVTHLYVICYLCHSFLFTLCSFCVIQLHLHVCCNSVLCGACMHAHCTSAWFCNVRPVLSGKISRPPRGARRKQHAMCWLTD